MSYDKGEFLAKVKEKAEQRQSQMIPAVRALQAVGVIMAKVTTGSDDWNRYLSFLQGQIDKTRGRRDAAQAKLNDPAIWDGQQMTKLKSDILQADAMIAAWEFAMQLPKALIDGGEEATEFLNKLGRENDSQEPANQG